MKQFPLEHTPSYKAEVPNHVNEIDKWFWIFIHYVFFIRFISRELPSPTELFRVSGCRERLPIGFYRLPKARASVRTCFAVRFYYQIHSGDKSCPFNGPINRAQCPITVLLITRPPIKMEKMKAKKKRFRLYLYFRIWHLLENQADHIAIMAHRRGWRKLIRSGWSSAGRDDKTLYDDIYHENGH